MKTLQDYVQEARKKTFERSDQLTLGQIIEKLESCGLKHGDKKEDKQVDYDFGTAIPTKLDSWRGSYNELALGYKLSGYDNIDDHFAQTTAENLLSELKGAIGKTYTGWKGGDFEMDENTPVWVANNGDSGNTGIIDIVDDGWRIIIMTAYCEY